MNDTLGSRSRKGSHEELKSALDGMANRLRRTAAAAAGLFPRTNLSAGLEKICRAATNATDLGASVVNRHPVLGLAGSARSVFELYIRAKHIQLCDQNIVRWAEEAWIDRIQLYEGILSLPMGSAESRQVIADEISRTKEQAAARGLNCSRRIPSVADVAREAGLDEDYKAFYKFYSKLVHPSSYLVNSSPEEVANQANLMILSLHLQLYGHALVACVCKALELDEEKVAPASAIKKHGSFDRLLEDSGS